MILSTSSSRAVSIRIGTSLDWRIRLHTSIPSMSGSLRSRTIRFGMSSATCESASEPVEAVRTRYPAFFRYSATNDAIELSSSTTRTVGVWLLTSGCRDDGLDAEGDELLHERHRLPFPVVDRIGPWIERVRVARQPRLADADRGHVDARGVRDREAVPAAREPEVDVLADVELHARIRRRLRVLRAADLWRQGVVGIQVGDAQRAGVELAPDGAPRTRDRDARGIDILELDHAVAARRGRRDGR